jgi:hypothetical protein
MRENYDAFRERLDARVPDWKVLTGLFSDAGLTDRYGNKPKPESARKLWQRIKRETERERSEAERPTKVSVREKPPSAPIVTTTPPPPSAPSSELERVLGDMKAKERKFPDVV